MGLLKPLMIFGKTGLQGLPTRVTLSLRAPLFMGSCDRLGEGPNTWKHFGPEPTQVQYSAGRYTWRLSCYYSQCSIIRTELVGRLGSDGFWKDSEDYGWGVRVSRHFAAR